MNQTSRNLPAFAFIALLFMTLACRSYHRLQNTEILTEEDLSGQSFSFIELVGVDFSNKNLRGTDFTRADLTDSKFNNADLTGVIFDMTVLRGADFSGATLDERWVPIIDLLTTGEGAGQDFRGVDLSDVYLPAADLSGSDLRGADLSDAHLANADLSDANLSGANLQGTNLFGAILHNVDVTDAQVNRYTNLDYASLVGALVSAEQWRVLSSGLYCTRLPDGTISDEEPCKGTPPPR